VECLALHLASELLVGTGARNRRGLLTEGNEGKY
jgi:hypothetical protein